MRDPESVRRQYESETPLETRRAVWSPGPSGVDPVDVVLREVGAALPASRALPDVLELGCGTGALAERIRAAHPGAALIATDLSARMVARTAERGIPARVMDAAAMDVPSASYDVVVAAWMLYHLPDLDAGLAEVRRVLRPGGSLVAVTLGEEHVADLRRDAGGEPIPLSFSAENGEAWLRRHFAEVRRTDVETRATFPDHDAALTYLRSTGEDVDWSLAPFDGPRSYAGHVTVFTATT